MSPRGSPSWLLLASLVAGPRLRHGGFSSHRPQAMAEGEGTGDAEERQRGVSVHGSAGRGKNGL